MYIPQYKIGELITMRGFVGVMIKEILPNGKYKVVLPDVVNVPKEDNKNYTTNIAVVEPRVQYVIKHYE